MVLAWAQGKGLRKEREARLKSPGLLGAPTNQVETKEV